MMHRGIASQSAAVVWVEGECAVCTAILLTLPLFYKLNTNLQLRLLKCIIFNFPFPFRYASILKCIIASSFFGVSFIAHKAFIDCANQKAAAITLSTIASVLFCKKLAKAHYL